MSCEEPALEGLLDDSDDLHCDAILRAATLAAAGFGAGLLASSSRASAAENLDVGILQTAASIENVAVATYSAALTLPSMAAAPPVLRTFAMKTRDQHAEHGRAFNAAVVRMGGKAQDKANPALAKIADDAKPSWKSALDVVDLALELEAAAAQTYNANAVTLADVESRRLVASVMGVEAQHMAILYAVRALLQAGAPQLVALPPEAGRLPAAAGSLGFPDVFLLTDKARPNDEGAVK